MMELSNHLHKSLKLEEEEDISYESVTKRVNQNSTQGTKICADLIRCKGNSTPQKRSSD